MPNNSKIRFRGRREVAAEISSKTEHVTIRRFKIVMIAILVVGLIFGSRLFTTQVNKQAFYEEKFEQYSSNTFPVDALRGEISDRNYKRLVYNKNVICATYYAVKNITEEERVAIVNFLLKNCKVDISEVTTREKKDYLIMKDEDFVKSLITKDEVDAIKTDDDFDTKYYNLQLKRITKKILKKHLSNQDIRYYKLYYAIKSCTSGSARLLEDISVKEASIIGANNDLLRGVRVTSDWKRTNKYKSTLSQTLGKVSTKKQGIPATIKDQLLALDYSNDSRVGTSGLESQYEEILSGQNSTYSMSYDADGNPIVKLKQQGSNGNNVRLTIDINLQEKIGNYCEKELIKHRGEGYNDHIYCILMDPNNGDIIAMVGKAYDHDTHKVYDYSAGNYLSAYRIGSTMKASVIYTCFKEHVIKRNHYENDTAEGIKIKGTKAKHSWNLKGLGRLNEVSALAYSSNIYMMKIIIKLGKGNYKYNEPLTVDDSAFTKLRNGAGELGLGVKTGLDVPYESLGYRGTSTNAGQLLDFSIGQYDTYTPIQLATMVSTIANNGVKVQPHLYKSSYIYDQEGITRTLDQVKKVVLDDVSDQTTAFKQIKKGMRSVVTYGTAASTFSGFKWAVAGKTGTAEDYTHTGNTDYPNHIFVGFAPYKKPKICVVTLAERQKSNNSAYKLARYALQLYLEKYK